MMVEFSMGAWRISIERAAPAIADVARIYDAAAWRWHSVISLLGYSRVYRILFDALATDGWLRSLPVGARILDGGVGTAALSMALAKTLPDAHDIHGIDISPRMLARARDNFRRLERPDVAAHLRYGDIDCLPYRMEEFDMVMSAHLLEYSPDPLRTIREMTRVLRAGAPLLIITTRPTWISRLHSFRWRYRAIGSGLLRQWLAQAGFSDIRRYELSSGRSLPSPLSDAHIARKRINEWVGESCMSDSRT